MPRCSRSSSHAPHRVAHPTWTHRNLGDACQCQLANKQHRRPRKALIPRRPILSISTSSTAATRCHTSPAAAALRHQLLFLGTNQPFPAPQRGETAGDRDGGSREWGEGTSVGCDLSRIGWKWQFLLLLSHPGNCILPRGPRAAAQRHCWAMGHWRCY